MAENAVLVWTQGQTGIKDAFSDVSGLVCTVPKTPLFQQPIGFIDVREVFAIKKSRLIDYFMDRKAT